MNKEIIRTGLVAQQQIFEQYLKDHRALYKEAIKVIEAESDMEKRKELIDYFFAGGIDDVIEHIVRKEYLK
jgi:hypothetical protein